MKGKPMGEREFRMAANYAKAFTSNMLGVMEKVHGRAMRRLVTRLQSLPEWERIRPTPELARREWGKMLAEDAMRSKTRRRRKYQRRLPA